MYAICDNMRPLSEVCFLPCSFIESILFFSQRFPHVESVNIYRDIRGTKSLKDLQYIATLSAKSIQSLKNKYLSNNKK